MKNERSEGISDPKLFEEMCVPHNSVDEAEAAWVGFWNDVYTARKKHRIAQVALVGDVHVKMEGKTMSYMPVSSMGNSDNTVWLLAKGLGVLRKQEQDNLDKLSRGETTEAYKPKRRK